MIPSCKDKLHKKIHEFSSSHSKDPDLERYNLLHQRFDVFRSMSRNQKPETYLTYLTLTDFLVLDLSRAFNTGQKERVRMSIISLFINKICKMRSEIIHIFLVFCPSF